VRLSKPRRLAGWIPVHIDCRTAEPVVDWCYLGRRRFLEPFFNDTISATLWQPGRLLFRHRTPIEALLEWQAEQPGLEPTGFVYHMSRCGSTLVSRMLATVTRNVVISEPDPVDTLVRLLPFGRNEDRRVALLRALISALGQTRTGAESQLFVKLDCWLTSDLPLIRRAFPTVPWIFVYRNPIEVLVSQLNQRGVHTIPSLIPPSTFGIDDSLVPAMPPEEYCARVLGSICSSAVRGLECGGGLLLDYSQLPDAVWSTLPKHFRIQVTGEERNHMRLSTWLDAKNPIVPFEDDRAAKHRAASDLAMSMAERWIGPHYARLESLRCAPGRMT
jgi:hypothetical protein